MSVKDVEADPIQYNNFEEYLTFELESRNKKLDYNQIMINSMLQSLIKEENIENFIKQYDELLKFKWIKEVEEIED